MSKIFFSYIIVHIGMDTVVSKDNDFNDFDDLSEHKSLKGNLEMYDYGEDFDCGDEENGKMIIH